MFNKLALGETPGTVFTTIPFRMSASNKLECYIKQAGKACQWATLLLIGPIHKLWRNEVFVYIAPGAVFTTLHFLCNLWVSGSNNIKQTGKAYQVTNTLAYWVHS